MPLEFESMCQPICQIVDASQDNKVEKFIASKEHFLCSQKTARIKYIPDESIKTPGV